jgi:predicted nucleic acid-binding protein
VPDAPAIGVLDTSVIVALDSIPPEVLPDQFAVSTVSLAELAAGPHATADPLERAMRQDRLQRVETTFEVLPFDARAARAFGFVVAVVAALGRQPRGRRTVDLLIASTAIAAKLPLYTRNPSDLVGLDELLEVHVV